jgi:hypothetical protein
VRTQLRVIYLRHLATLALLLPSFLLGQDIAGDWQGTLKFGKIESRLVITIAKGANGGWCRFPLISGFW